MTSIALVTPVTPSRAEWLGELADAIEELRSAAAGRHEVDWIVSTDGPEALKVSGADCICTVLPGGPAAARTRAMAAARCEWVLPIDADDLPDTEGVLAVLDHIDVLPPSVGWVGGGRVLLDGSATAHTRVAERDWGEGTLAEAWEAPFVFHPNSILVRRELALASGGWPALRVNEDLAFVLLISEIAPGRTVPQTLTRYRVWEGQTVGQSDYPAAKRVAFETIAELVNARRATKGRTIIAPPPAGGAFGAVKS